MFSPCKVYHNAANPGILGQVKPSASQWEATFLYDIGFATVNHNTVANFWYYPIRPSVIFVSALELPVMAQHVVIPNFKLKNTCTSDFELLTTHSIRDENE